MESSKMVLGTAQLGMNYGINNFKGKPSRQESLELLDRAYEKGIRTFDTAFAYGDAEEIVGEFVTTRNLSNQVQIISKLEPNCVPENSKNVFGIIESRLSASLDRTNAEVLDCYLLHTSPYIFREEIVHALHQCKTKGLVKNIGVSVYEEAEALAAVRSPLIDYIQIPYNVFDQRLHGTDFFQIAKANNKKVFARTAFLQGLIFMDEAKIPGHLSGTKKYLKEFDDIIARYGLSRLEASLMFSASEPGIDHIVFGVDTKEQLDEDMNVIADLHYYPACIAELRDRFSRIKESVIFPSLWKK
ncbi:MAG: aldo/keto reductase [Candidatus Wildermuthbacteria bacterium]|nr:aldo/keto reductase [Candidatus Wildermuthbacteria bacterium]